MFRRYAITGLAFALTGFTGAGGVALLGRSGTRGEERARIAGVQPAQAYGRLPLVFEANGGRTDKRVRFIAHGAGHTLFLTPRESVLSVQGKRGAAVVRTRLKGAAPNPDVEGFRGLPGVVNSLIGRDRSSWRTGIPTYGRVRMREVYPGIDLVYYGKQGKLEYDFVVRPGADPDRIHMHVDGASRLTVDSRGDLVARTAAGAIRQLRPVVYQERGGRRQRVGGRYVVSGHDVRFELGRYDRHRALRIDPVLAYSTYLGGSAEEGAKSIAVDPSGAAYVFGATGSSDFPGTAAGTYGGGVQDLFVTKLNPQGNAIVYSTYIGGSSDEFAGKIAVDSSGNAYFAAQSLSNNFPTTAGAYQAARGGAPASSYEDAVAGKLSANGSSLSYATYLGGAHYEVSFDIALDSANRMWLTGETCSSDFPTAAAYDATAGGCDGFFSQIDPTLSGPASLVSSSHLGGAGGDSAFGIAVDTKDQIWVVGDTSSTDFPVTIGAVQATKSTNNAVEGDAFLAGFNAAGSSLRYGTYLGGTAGDYAADVAAGDWITLVGITGSDNFDTTQFAFDTSYGGQFDAFVTRFYENGQASVLTLSVSSYLGGADRDMANGVAEGPTGTLTIVGETSSGDFPVQAPIQSAGAAGEQDGFVYKMDWETSRIYSTRLGGTNGNDSVSAVAVGPGGVPYIAGGTGATDFPIRSPLQAASGGNGDGFVAKLVPKLPVIDSGPSGATSDSTPTFTWHDGESSNGTHCRLDSDDAAAFGALPCGSPRTISPALADGSHTLDLRPFDAAGDFDSATYLRRSFIVDTVPPSASTLQSPQEGEQVPTARPTFTWSAASDATTSVGYELLIDGAKVADLGADACSNGACTAQTPAALANGPHTARVDAIDAAANTTAGSTRGFIVAVPLIALITIAPNPALVGNPVTFEGAGSSSNVPITRFEWDLDGDGTFETDTGASTRATKSYSSPGTIHVSLRVTDAGGISATTNGDVKVNAPQLGSGQFGVSVNNGAQYTNDPNVTITSVFPQGTTSLLFSNDGGFFAPASFTPKRETSWKLDSSGPERLPKIVYVRFLVGPIVSQNYSDDIILDETPPKVQQASVATAAGAASVAALKKFTVKIKASDSNSGVDKVQVTANKRKPGKLIRYKRKLTVRLAARPKFVRARDRAGNFSRWRVAK